MVRIVTLREFMQEHFRELYRKEITMPDMPKDNIPDNVLSKVAGTSKCADDEPQDDCCEYDDEEEDDD